MRIDSHQHFWKPDRGDYDWMPPDLPILNRNYLPEDLLPHLQKHRVDRTILVQAASTVAETDFILSLATQHPFIAGVVGWLEMDRDDFPDLFERYRTKDWFVGVRPVIHDIPDEAWMVRPRVLDHLKLLAEHDFPFDFLTRPQHLPYVLKVLERVPGLRAVIDHISKPLIKEGKMQPWMKHITEVAAYPNVFCKVSGMITEADHQRWTIDHLKPYVDHVKAVFGADRLMYGSDWPVCLLAGSYDRVIGAAEALTSDLGTAAMEKIFGLNAARFYKVG